MSDWDDHCAREKMDEAKRMSHHYEVCPLCFDVYEAGELVQIGHLTAQDFDHVIKPCKYCVKQNNQQ